MLTSSSCEYVRLRVCLCSPQDSETVYATRPKIAKCGRVCQPMHMGYGKDQVELMDPVKKMDTKHSKEAKLRARVGFHSCF